MRDALEICGKASTDTALLRRGVYADEDEICLLNGLVDIRGEEQVAATADFDDIDETGLVDGEAKVVAVPRVDAGLVEIDDGDLDVGAFEGNDGARRATCASA